MAYVERLVSQSAELATAHTLTYQFLTLVHTGDASALERWFTAVEQSGLPELASFAAGLRRDRAAVEAALTSPWSNGQTEGQVNRLKTIKRQLYGRAGFALLRQRVLRSA